MLDYHPFQEGVIVFLGIYKVIDVDSLTQLLGRTHLLLEVGRDCEARTNCAGVAGQVGHPH